VAWGFNNFATASIAAKLSNLGTKSIYDESRAAAISKF
jgi:hypothetical protein